MPILELDASNYDATIKATSGIALVRMHALWCEHCRMFAHAIEKAASEFQNDATFFEVNIGQNKSLARALRLENIPALAWYADGELKEICVGVFTPEEIKAKIDSLKASSAAPQ